MVGVEKVLSPGRQRWGSRAQRPPAGMWAACHQQSCWGLGPWRKGRRWLTAPLAFRHGEYASSSHRGCMNWDGCHLGQERFQDSAQGRPVSMGLCASCEGLAWLCRPVLLKPANQWLDDLDKMQTLTQSVWVELRFCISRELLRDDHGAGHCLWTTLWVATF